MSIYGPYDAHRVLYNYEPGLEPDPTRFERLLRPRFFIIPCKLVESMGQANESELLIVGAIVTIKTLTPTVIL
jgi:hypothetical protein